MIEDLHSRIADLEQRLVAAEKRAEEAAEQSRQRQVAEESRDVDRDESIAKAEHERDEAHARANMEIDDRRERCAKYATERDDWKRKAEEAAAEAAVAREALTLGVHAFQAADIAREATFNGFVSHALNALARPSPLAADLLARLAKAEGEVNVNRDERAVWSRLYGRLAGHSDDFQGCYSLADLDRAVGRVDARP